MVLLSAISLWSALAPAPTLHTLIVGGGPGKRYNQAAIESNVRYVNKLLPEGAPVRVLYANGKADSSIVQCQREGGKVYYRTPELPKMDGPSLRGALGSELETLAHSIPDRSADSILLYFTGHGSPNAAQSYENNAYCLWDDDQYRVTELAERLKSVQKDVPVTLVMVQCYSGAFGNLLFEGGKADAAFAQHPFCGFFASVSQRPAAGCTPEVNEAVYKDFTGYFFAALSGVDRTGQKVDGADFDHDGKVSMSEAFAYTLIHDDSIDTPVCTTDVFLRRYVEKDDKEVFRSPKTEVKKWATPSQLAALTALEAQLGVTEEPDGSKMFQKLMESDFLSEDIRETRLIRWARMYKSIVLTHILKNRGSRELKRNFAKLVELESRNPLGVK